MRAASGRLGSARSDTPAQNLAGSAPEPHPVERTGRGDFIVKVISPAGPPRKVARRDFKSFGFKSPKALDERVMELERKVELMRTGAPQFLEVSTLVEHGGHIGDPVWPGSFGGTTVQKNQAPRQPTPYRLDGPLDRSRMTVKATDPATLSKERGRTIMTRFGLDPDTEEE
ncbi:hypothetical protein [Paraburkholderia adhaesiva]|uniref:hypothetical protein n=1 Tax=Paraburkholderia adhaesiva TaxID=2883244 RepID=UPI001F37544C|nr:hypothetical protein [Paraburkholderia adhaesiva]